MIAPFSHTPQAFLFGYVTSNVPGYRKLNIGGTVYTLGTTGAEGLLWSTYITGMDTAISASGWSLEWSAATGKVTLSGLPQAVSFPDSLGALCGFAVDPGTSVGTVATVESVRVPYAAIPLYGATWSQVDMQRSVEYDVDRMSRTVGYNWGGAQVWRWRLTMDTHSLTALRYGWCLNGKVRIEGKGIDGPGTSYQPISSSNDGGYLEGYPLGIAGLRWLDDVQSIAEVDVLVSAGAP